MLLWVATVSGLGAFFYPFLLPLVPIAGSRDAVDRPTAAPLVLAAVVALSVAVAFVGMAENAASAKTVALLATLIASDATLRLVPSLAGASTIFLLILLVGATFGPSYGFLMGSGTLLLSAALTGGVGPWLPYQMLGAGWVGLSAGWMRGAGSNRGGIVALAALGALWGLAYGALLNLYAWPFAAPDLDEATGLYWSPGLDAATTLQRYAAYYLATSLAHDLFRAVGNALLVVLLGPPLLRVLARARRRFA